MTSNTSLEIRTFLVDVTPPVGDWLCGGFHDRAAAVESPLHLRGVIISTPSTRYIVACIDYCYLVARSQQRLLDALAEGAGIPAGQVVCQSNHTHAAPLIAEEAHGIVSEVLPDLRLHNEEYFGGVCRRARETVAAALKGAGFALGGAAFASCPVHEFASSRRVLDAQGRCGIRWSVTADLAVRSAPVGRIDPLLDQIVLHDTAGTPRVCLGYYACHPQTADRRRPMLVSRDTVGVALDLFEKTHPGVFPIHFDGCGGDVTAGKYTTPALERNRLVFGVRLFDAMEEAFASARGMPVESLEWIDRTFEVPLAPATETEEALAARIRDPGVDVPYKVLAGWKIQRLRRGRDTYPFRATRVKLGHLSALFLPTELCVEYQLYAKARCRGPLAVAAYGDSFLNYVATDEAFGQGGYEVRPNWTEVGPGIEPVIKRHIDAMLGD